jgi:glycerol-3-phosphate acyltransferase PlsX
VAPARVAVDAMGGDNAPDEIVAGAILAHEDGVGVLLVGRDLPSVPAGIEVVEAADVIAMDDPDPAKAVRARRSSSVAVASRLVKEGRADAVFSAGSTGAALAAGVLEVGRIRGVARPALAVVLPFGTSPTVLIDVGANADVRPEHLAGFAALGSVFAQATLGVARPRVGLLSIGEEPGKGSELARQAFPLVEAAVEGFIGNVEGRDIPTEAVDVVVTDGFTGNVVLKTLEGFGRFLMGELMDVFSASEKNKAAAEVLLPDLLELAATLSPDSTGGAHLVGVKGVCIIGHGSSNAEAVRNALRVASSTVEAGLVGAVTGRLGKEVR